MGACWFYTGEVDYSLEKRLESIDLIKTIAILGVILIHVSAAAITAPVGSETWYSGLVWGAVCRGSVPLFLMCSGVLMLQPEKDLSLQKLYGRSLPRLLIALFVWAILYEILHGVLDGSLSWDYVRESIRDILLFRHEFHLYYLHIMLLVYVCLPITRLLIASATRRQLEYVLILWFILGILYPTLRNFWPFNRLRGIPAQWMLNMTYSAGGYGILGCYLWRSSHDRKTNLLCPGCLLLGIGLGITLGGVWGISWAVRATDTRLWEGMSLGPACMAAGIFLLCCNGKAKGSARLFWVCRRIAEASFSIYLSHVVFLELLRRWSWSVTVGCTMLRIPITGLLILGCSYCLYLLLRRLPWAKRWLI